MFELIAETTERPLRERSPISKFAALGLHVAVVAGLAGVATLQGVKVLSSVPPMTAFVVPSPVPLLMPPPPPVTRQAPRKVEQSSRRAAESAAPVELPTPGSARA